MQYVSLLYLLAFLPLVLLAYGLSPQRHRWKLLLAASYIFYGLLSKTLIIYLLFSTISIHELGLWLNACQDGEKERKRRILWYGVFVHIGLLAVLKYSAFFLESLNAVLPLALPVPSFVLPAGISFFTLQAVSYLSDVYHGRIRGDESLGRLALYLAFFPAIVEGPICRYAETAEELYAGRPLTYKNITFGAQRMVWGLFKKLVVADRLNIFVQKIFTHWGQYSGLVVLLGAAAYTLQLYADFSGCIDLTIGTAELFGVRLPENFRQPFFSRTASEFWRRWHITLGTWFKDYIFYPLSLTRPVKALGRKARKTLGRRLGQTVQVLPPLLAVWVCNGLWHGAGWNYLFFGLYYFVLIVFGNLLEPAADRASHLLGLSREGGIWRVFQTVKMAAIVVTGELFFRAEGLAAGFAMFGSIFSGWNRAVLTDGTLLRLGLDACDFGVIAAGTLVMLAVDLLHERGVCLREKLAQTNLPLRWTICLAAVLAVVIFGAYGAGYAPVDPLYAGF